jgi:hypothetical protein
MTTDPQSPNADPADVAEQQREVVPSVDDEEAPAPEPDVPLEADEADVAEQRTDLPGWVDEEEP